MHLLQSLFWLATFQVSLVEKHIATRFHVHSATIRGPSRTGGTATISSSRLNITELDNLVEKYFTKGQLTGLTIVFKDLT